MWVLQNIEPGLEGLSMAIFTRALGWSKEEAEVFLVDVRKDIKDTKIHCYWEMYVPSLSTLSNADACADTTSLDKSHCKDGEHYGNGISLMPFAYPWEYSIFNNDNFSWENPFPLALPLQGYRIRSKAFLYIEYKIYKIYLAKGSPSAPPANPINWRNPPK
jgi:hypothetical protein